MKIKKRKVLLDIIDLSFVTMKKPGYLFYGGEVLIRPLFGDENRPYSEYIHYEEISSKPIEVGIKNLNSEVDTSSESVPSDMCYGNLNQHTCLVRLKSADGNAVTLFIVRFPSQQFEKIQGYYEDADIYDDIVKYNFTITEGYKEENEFVYLILNTGDIEVDSLVSLIYYKVSVVLCHIFKIYICLKLYPVNAKANTNTCLKNSTLKQCSCGDKCVKCDGYESPDRVGTEIRVSNISPSCEINPLYSNYNFSEFIFGK